MITLALASLFIRRWLDDHAALADAQHRWQQARTLVEAGELTARWLEGTMAHYPAYGGPPDEETVELVPCLAALNRAGFVTYGSQPGGFYPHIRYPQVTVWSCATVLAFCDDTMLEAIYDAAEGTDLRIITYETPPKRWWRRRSGWPRFPRRADLIEVTGDEFGIHSEVGYRMDYTDIEQLMGWAGEQIIDTLAGAWQVTIIDPEHGRNDLLWATLIKAMLSTRDLSRFEQVPWDGPPVDDRLMMLDGRRWCWHCNDYHEHGLYGAAVTCLNCGTEFDEPAGVRVPVPRLYDPRKPFDWAFSPDLDAYVNQTLPRWRVRCAVCGYAPCGC